MAGKNVQPVRLVLEGVDESGNAFRDIYQKLEGVRRVTGGTNRSLALFGSRLKLPGVGSSLRGVGRELGNLAASAKNLVLGGGIFGAGALYSMQRFIEYGDQIGDSAAAIGTTASALQELRFTAGQLGVDEGLDAGLLRFNKAVGVAITRDGPMRRMFGALRINLKEAGKTRDTVDLLGDLADRVQGLSPQAQTAIVGQFLGNKQLVTFFQQGSAGIKRYREEARALGGVLDDNLVRSLGEAKDEISKLKFAALGGAAVIGQELLPDVRQMVVSMTAWLQANRGWLRDTVVPEIREFAAWVRDTAPKVWAVVDALGGLKAVALGTAAIVAGPLILAVTQLGIAMVGFAASFVTAQGLMMGLGLLLNPWVLAGAALIALGTQLYEHWRPFKVLVDQIWSSITDEKVTGAKLIGPQVAPPGWTPPANARGPGSGVKLPAAEGANALQKSFRGSIGVDLFLPKGVGSYVRKAESSRGLDLDVGASMAFGG